MKQKTIIQLWGTQGGGKSSTINIVREELIIKYINPSHTYPLPLPGGEISDLIICNNYKIGLESMGDDLWYGGLKERLDDHIISKQCDILICASRVYNNVNTHLQELSVQCNYRILKVTNYRGNALAFNRDHLNQISAKHIILLVEQIMMGQI